ncbi:MAG: hypothetical protein HZA93_23970 [Verrucomicrobia bacterium]|nr:hypothetical protein [Verrucomicrobiota bacterium]
MGASTNNPVIRGDNSVLWGANGVYNGSGSGYVLSGSDELTGEKLEIQDELGQTVAVVFFDDKHNVEFEAIIKTSAPDIARGDGLTICGLAYALVESVTLLWENKGVRKYRVKATKYSAIAAPA